MNKWFPSGKGKRLSKTEIYRRKAQRRRRRTTAFLSRRELEIMAEWCRTGNFVENYL